MENDTTVNTATTTTHDPTIETTPLGAAKVKKGRKWLWGAGIGLLAAFALLAAVLGATSHSSASGSSNSSSTPTAPPANPATTLDNTLAPWAQYIANNENTGGITMWMSTVGEQSPVEQLPMSAAEVFWQEEFQVGANQASMDMYNNLMNASTQFVQQNPNFDPSTIPSPPS